MSRAIAISASLDEVQEHCAKLGVGISVIEPLASGGTRVVFNTINDADLFRRGMKARIINTPVVRSSLYVSRKTTPYT